MCEKGFLFNKCCSYMFIEEDTQCWSYYRSFSLKRAICLSTEPPVFSKMTNFQKQSRKTKSCSSWKYSNVILQTLLKDPSKGCKRLQKLKNEGQVKRCYLPTVPLHSSSFPSLSSLFLTAAASAAGLVEKHDKKSQILTILTKN